MALSRILADVKSDLVDVAPKHGGYATRTQKHLRKAPGPACWPSQISAGNMETGSFRGVGQMSACTTATKPRLTPHERDRHRMPNPNAFIASSNAALALPVGTNPAPLFILLPF